MGIIHTLFNANPANHPARKLLEEGAIVIDVRTPAEYKTGHVEGSLNYPLQSISSQVEKIKKLGKPVVLCCASGMRSGQASSILKGQEISCENGGSWKKVDRMLQQLER